MLNILNKHLKLIIGWGVFFAVLSLGVSLFFPQQYSASSQVLIISRDRAGVDPYTQVKAAERIGENLAQVMGTTDFYGKVMSDAGATFDKSVWQNLNDRELRKKWSKDVTAQMAYGSSLLNITVYSKTKEDVAALSKTVTDVVSTRGWEYVGGDVAIKVVNSALVSRFPARPNYIVNAVVGLVLGMLLAGWWVMKYKKHLFSIS